jgi:hypothetical protein
MAHAFAGDTGSGSVLVYTVPSGYVLALDLLRFEVTTDGTAGIHKARVRFYDNALNAATASLRDLNEGGASEVLTYTYGLGLNASACVTVNGWEMTDALPETVLAPNTDIYVAMVNDAGVVIAGDAIGPVTLYGDLLAATADTGVTLEPGLLPV